MFSLPHFPFIIAFFGTLFKMEEEDILDMSFLWAVFGSCVVEMYMLPGDSCYLLDAYLIKILPSPKDIQR